VRAELHLTVPAQKEVLEPTRQAVLGHLSGWDLSAKALFNVELVLEETLLNTILHGFGGGDSATHTIEVRVQVTPDDVELRFEDDGKPFDPTQAAEPVRPLSLDQAAPGGLGLMLVRKLARSVHYQRVDGRNTLSVRVGRC